MTVIVTDARYRASIAAVRSLAKAGHKVITVQTAAEAACAIPAFKSKYSSESLLLDCSDSDCDKYTEKLIELAKKYDRPVIFPIGAKTTAMLASNKDALAPFADFTVADADVLALANDKKTIERVAKSLSIPTPTTYENGAEPEAYPVIIKPRCGEAYGLKAHERYRKAYSKAEYTKAYCEMSKYGGDPIVQKLVFGDGIGVSLLMDKSGRAVSAICHRRVREYPCEGGPSACCESFYDEKLIGDAQKLLSSIGFVGMAMVEFKGEYLLEVNPRVWGSFPLTYVASSRFADDYVKLSVGETLPSFSKNYIVGARMNFLLSDLAACADLLRHGRVGESLSGIGDILLHRAHDGIYDKNDPAPQWCYLKEKIFKNRRRGE